MIPTTRLFHFPQRRRRRGFSFIEIMFAVVILGIGFIMTASIFPVVVTQVQTTQDDTTAAAVARGTLVQLGAWMNDAHAPSTEGTIETVNHPPAFTPDAGSPDQIVTGDRRYAWVALYRRLGQDSYAQVWMFVVRNRTGGEYTATLPQREMLEARGVKVRVVAAGDGELGRIVVLRGADGNHGAVGEGAYVVIAALGPTGQDAGQTYRIGRSLRADVEETEFEIAPGGNQPAPADERVDPTAALVVGRPPIDPSDPSRGFGDAVQDVMLYTSFVAVNP